MTKHGWNFLAYLCIGGGWACLLGAIWSIDMEEGVRWAATAFLFAFSTIGCLAAALEAKEAKP